MKYKLYIDKCPDNMNYDLITYYSNPSCFIIQKYRCEDNYTLWFSISDRITSKNMQLLGKFKTLKEAKEFAYKWYVDNL